MLVNDCGNWKSSNLYSHSWRSSENHLTIMLVLWVPLATSWLFDRIVYVFLFSLSKFFHLRFKVLSCRLKRLKILLLNRFLFLFFSFEYCYFIIQSLKDIFKTHTKKFFYKHNRSKRLERMQIAEVNLFDFEWATFEFIRYHSLICAIAYVFMPRCIFMCAFAFIQITLDFPLLFFFKFQDIHIIGLVQFLMFSTYIGFYMCGQASLHLNLLRIPWWIY